MNEIPCKDCICFAVCNSIFKEPVNSKNGKVICELIGSCTVIKDYLLMYHEDRNSYNIFAFPLFINNQLIRINIEPLISFFENEGQS